MVEGVEANAVILPYSRLLIDVERFADDLLEPMSERGMGIIYSNGHALNNIRRDMTDNEREELIALYWEHHNLLEKSVDVRSVNVLDQFFTLEIK